MNRSPSTLLALFLICQAFLFISGETSAGDKHIDISRILDPAEKFFVSLKDRKYGTAWDLLSAESHSTIIDNVYNASRKDGSNIQKLDITRDFENRGIICNSYWNAFLETFDPDMVLKESRWEMGPIEKDEAEIIIMHRRSDFPARLRMFKENGTWKVGFSETFGIRNF